MGTRFDPDAGVLEVRHAALAVLAMLAADPTSPRLIDHAVAPLLAELKAAGLVGSKGIHPAVEPLAKSVGAAGAMWWITADDHGRQHLARLWVGHDLAVLGVEVDQPHTYALMADTPAMAPTLVGEFVGLVAAGTPAVSGTRVVRDYAGVVASGSAASAEAVAQAIGAPPDDPWARAFADAVRGAAVQWRITARSGGAQTGDIAALDAGAAGLWLAVLEGEDAEVGPISVGRAREAMAGLLG